MSIGLIRLTAGFLFFASGPVHAALVYKNSGFYRDGVLCERRLVDSRTDRLTKPAGIGAGFYPAGTRLGVYAYEVNCPNTSPFYATVYYVPGDDDRPFAEQMVPFLSEVEQAVTPTAVALDPYIVGYAPAGNESSNPYHAFRYNIETGEMLDLSSENPEQFSIARGVSNDGSIVVGIVKENSEATFRAFRWTEDTGLVSLGGLTPDGYSLGFGISLDGQVIVGEAASVPSAPGEFSKIRAFRWTEAGGMVDLGGLEPNATSSAQATNRDGSVVVGLASAGFTETHAFRWEAGVMQDIGALDGDRVAMATAVSADGNVVVGISSNNFITPSNIGPLYDDASRAFRWTEATAMQDLNVLAADAGVDMDGITMISALYVSADGTLISGAAFTPDSPDERTAYTLRYEDFTTGADAIDAGFVDLTVDGSGGGGIDTFTETQALASLDAAGLSLGTAAAQSGATTALALNRYGSWMTPQGHDLTAFATTGGVGSGLRGFAELTDGVTLYGGVVLAQPDFGDVSFGSETLGALALRYDTTGLLSREGSGSSFVEVVGSFGQIDDLVVARPYETGTGSGTGIGQTKGTVSSLGVRAGILNPIGAQDVLGVAASIGKQWFSTDAFAEADSALNPFPASYAAGSSSWTIASIEAQWTRAITPAMDLAVTAGWNHAFAADGGLTADFTGIGTVAGAGAGDVNWANIGAGVTYKVKDKVDLGLFIGSTFGSGDVTPQTYGSLAVTYFF